MLLTTYRAVPSGMSFDLDTTPARTASMLSTPGNACVVGLTGAGTWAVELLASNDGVNYTLIATLTTPGLRRYDTKGVAAIAVRVASYTAGSGIVSGMLAHGALIPTTNVSPLFGSFLVYSYNATPSEPPIGNQIRFNAAAFPQVTKVWLANTTVDGVDQYLAIRHVPYGGTLLVQNKSRYSDAILFNILAPPIDKTDYVEIPVAFQQAIGALVAQQVLVAVFNPGPVMAFTPVARDEAVIAPESLPIPLVDRADADEEEFIEDEDEEAEDAATEVADAVKARTRRGRPRG